MKKYDMKEVETAVGGRITSGREDSPVFSVSKDSRKATQEDLFFSIIGERQDGHQFIPQAVERGCRNFLISSREWEVKLKENRDITVIKVEDTTKALGKLAKDYRKKMDIVIVGITGSTGKTGTKDLARYVCAATYKTGYTKGNLNNHIGLPLSLLAFDEDTKVGVLEMGMDRPGEIDYLAEIARPNIGVITNIGVSHIENIGSREGIFNCKMEIAGYMDKGNLLIACEDGRFFTGEKMEKQSQNRYDCFLCGTGESCNLRISKIESRGEKGISFVLTTPEESRGFEIPIPGIHNAYNASLAVAVGMALGISMETAGQALSKARLTAGRLTVKEAGGVKVIDDTYNAGPDSVRGAVDMLMSTEGRRKIVVLGDMLELGEYAKDFHRQVGEYAREKGVDRLFTVGDWARYIALGYGKSGEFHKDKKKCMVLLEEEIQEGDVILVKGSRGMAMEEIVEYIIERRSK